MTEIRYRRDLYQLIKDHPCRKAAEIGVAEGYFSAEMLAWPINLETVYMVDRWYCYLQQKGDASQPQAWHDRNLAAALERVSPFGTRAVLLRGDSVVMAQKVEDRSLSLVYIDADHSYEGVWRDIHAWRQKVAPNGVMAFHDYEAPQYGVKRAVQEYCRLWDVTLHLLPEDAVNDAGAYFYVDLI